MRFVPWFVLLLSAPSCDTPTSSAPAGRASVTVVDGHAIYDEDIELALRASQRTPEDLTAEQRENVVHTLETRELRAQEAERLGLDDDPGYLEGLRRLEAQIAAYRRDTLSRLHYERSIVAEVEVTDEQARAFFERNADRIRTRHHVLQILRRGRAAIEQAQAQLDGGESFEEVAGRPFAELEGTRRPWDLGFLNWAQIPEPWTEVLATLEPGDVSPIIAGPNDRYWLVKLVERRTSEEITLDRVRDAIVSQLEKEQIEELRAQTDERLRRQAGLD